MRVTFILLVAIVGVSLAFTPGMEYKYKYEGRLGMGIPEIRNKFSAVGIKAIVTIQIKDTEKAIFKLSNIQVGEYVGEAGIHMTNTLPIQYTPMGEYGKVLEVPYEVFFNKDNKQAMLVPESDIEWIVNQRKSIALLFMNEATRGNFGHSSNVFEIMDFSTLGAFTLFEPTIFGNCSVDYSIVPVGFPETNDVNTMESNTYRMTRTVNFDVCTEKVELKLSSLDDSKLTSSLFGNVASRSSIMTVMLSGKPGSFVIREGNVQGYFSVNPFAVPSDKLMYITNQTYFLESSSKVVNYFVVPSNSRVIKTWLMQVASEFSAPVNPPSFMNYHNRPDPTLRPGNPYSIFTGMFRNANEILKFKTTFDKLISDAASLMVVVGLPPTGKINPMLTNEAKLITFLETAVRVGWSLDFKSYETLFETYFSDKSELGQMKLKLFIDVSAACGSDPPIKMLIKEMHNGRITPERITSIFTTLAANYFATPMLPDLLKYVKTLDIDANPILTSNAWLNFATILRKSCKKDEKTHIPAIYGSADCDMRIISEDFVPFLVTKFKTMTKPYQRKIVIETLSNLRTKEAIKFITEVVVGHYATEVREAAIFALHYPKLMGIISKDEVFTLLMPIATNVKEEPVLRQMAIGTMSFWTPSTAWYYRMAASTWSEPSKSVGSFISSIFKAFYHSTEPMYNREVKMSHFLLPLTKPFPPSSTFMNFYGRSNPKKYSSMFLDTGVVYDDKSTIPRNIYALLFNDFGGLKFPVFEALFSSSPSSKFSSEKMPNMNKMVPIELQKMIGGPNVNMERVLEEIKKYLTPNHITNENTIKDSSLVLRLFKYLQLMIPMNSDILPSMMNPDNFNIIEILTKGKDLHLSKFVKPVLSNIFFPTELGLPFFGTISAPIVQSAEGNVKFSFGGKESSNVFDIFSFKSFNVDLTTNYKLASKVVVDLHVSLPWNEKSLVLGVETMKSINLPLKFKMTFENQGHFKNVSFDFIPTHDKQFAAAHMHTIPFVGLKGMFDGEVPNEYEIFEVITTKGDGKGVHHNKFNLDKHYTGVEAEIKWEGDVPFPFTYGNFYDILNKPYKMMSKMLVSPTTKMFSSTFLFNFGLSETKSFHPSVAFTYPFFSKEDNTIPTKKTADPVDLNTAFIVKFMTKGTESRYFESNYQSKVLTKDETTKTTDFTYRYIQQLPRIKPQAFCINTETRQPIFYDLKTLLNSLTTRHMNMTFNSKIREGMSCKGVQFATIKGSFKLSDAKRSMLVDKITSELNINKNAVMYMKNIPFYDLASMLFEYKEPLPSFFTNMTYHMYDVLRGSQFPYIYNNYYNIKNPKGRIVVEGDRNTDGSWNMKADLPTETLNMDNFNLPFLYKIQFLFFGHNIHERYTLNTGLLFNYFE